MPDCFRRFCRLSALHISSPQIKAALEQKPYQKVEKLHISRGFCTRLYDIITSMHAEDLRQRSWASLWDPSLFVLRGPNFVACNTIRNPVLQKALELFPLCWRPDFRFFFFFFFFCTELTPSHSEEKIYQNRKPSFFSSFHRSRIVHSTRANILQCHFSAFLIGDSHDGQVFKQHGHVYDDRGQSWEGQFTRKRRTIVLIGWLA